MSSKRTGGGGPPIANMMNGGGGGADGSTSELIKSFLQLLVFTLVCYGIYAEFNGNSTEDEWSLTQTDGKVVGLDYAQSVQNITGTLFKSKKGGHYITWTFIDCFYFAMETVTTVGYGDIVPGNDTGKTITIFVCIVGVLAISQSVTTIANWFLEKKRLKALEDQRKMLDAAIEIAGGADAAADDESDNGGDAPELAEYWKNNPDQAEAFSKLPEAVRDASKAAFTELAKEAAQEEEDLTNDVENIDCSSPKHRRDSHGAGGKKVKRKNSHGNEGGANVSTVVPLKEDSSRAPVPVKVKMGTSQRLMKKFLTFCQYVRVIMVCFIPLWFYIGMCFVLGHIEGWSGLDSIYFSIITMTTVGFGDVTPFTQDGRLFAAFLLPFGLIALTIVIGLTMPELDKIGKSGEKTISDLLNELKEVIEDDDDGTVTEEEYLIFCLKSEGKVDEDTLDILRKQFQALDADGSGELDEDDVKQLTAAAKKHDEEARGARGGGSHRGSAPDATSTSDSAPSAKLEM